MKTTAFIFFLIVLVATGCRHGEFASPPPPVGGYPGEKCSDVESDLRRMWSVTTAENESWTVATDEAVLAANRVFNTLTLVGRNRADIPVVLRFDLRAVNYGYRAPFWPAEKNDLVIRIDTGSYGWQFDIQFDENDRVRTVVRRWIH